MDRYFFDIYNSEGQVLDEEGQLFASKESAKDDALRVLQDVARDEMPDRDLFKLTVKVRSENGAKVFEASLILTSGWTAKQP